MPEPKKNNHGTDGLLVDTWYYEYQGLQNRPGPDDEDEDEPSPDSKIVKGQKVKIELRLLKTFTGQEPPRALKSVKFLVKCKELGLAFDGTDIEALRAAMWDKLDEKYSTKWEEMYLVQINQMNYWHGISEGFTLSYETVWKGTAWDGTLLLKEINRVTDYKGRISPWPGAFQAKGGTTIACIPATEMNHDALHEFQRRIVALRKKLEDTVRPEAIIRTLANLAGATLLPAPAPEEPANAE